MARLLLVEDAPRLELAGRVAVQLLDGSTRGARMTVRVVEVAPEEDGVAPRPLHVHEGVGEFIWILEGRGTLHCPEGHLLAEAGQAVYVPPGERHKVVPIGSAPLRLLCAFATGDIAARTRE